MILVIISRNHKQLHLPTFVIILCFNSMGKHMTFFHFLSHLFVLSEPESKTESEPESESESEPESESESESKSKFALNILQLLSLLQYIK